jgi:hypothetical protein
VGAGAAHAGSGEKLRAGIEPQFPAAAACRVAKRPRAVVLNFEGRTGGELAGILKAPGPACCAYR